MTVYRLSAPAASSASATSGERFARARAFSCSRIRHAQPRSDAWPTCEGTEVVPPLAGVLRPPTACRRRSVAMRSGVKATSGSPITSTPVRRLDRGVRTARQGCRATVSRRISMASFSVVTNLASVNAQANLVSTNIGLQTGADRAVERPPHQQLGRRRGRPRRRQRVPLGHRGPEPGRPQRQRRSVEPADQGRRARQHLEAARSSLDAGHAGGLGSPRRPRPHHAERRVHGRPRRKSPRSRPSRASTTASRLLGVRQQQRHQRRRRRHHRRG